jgi:hypothetical protein
MMPTSAAAQASNDSALGVRESMRSGYNRIVIPLHRRVAPLLVLVAIALGPWTLYLTYSLPARHVARHYDLAWVGFDIALLLAFAVTGVCAYRATKWLVPAAAVTGTMLLCDAWFDIVTSAGGGERLEAVLEATFGELPLAVLCAYVIWDAERFVTFLPRRRALEQP